MTNIKKFKIEALVTSEVTKTVSIDWDDFTEWYGYDNKPLEPEEQVSAEEFASYDIEEYLRFTAEGEVGIAGEEVDIFRDCIAVEVHSIKEVD